MAFSLDKWARVSSGVYDASVVLFSYETTDSVADVSTAGYFDTAPEVGGNDAIIIAASDGTHLFKVSKSGSTLTASIMSDGNTLEENSVNSTHLADNSVDTAAIQNNAVTASKQATGLYPLYSKIYTTTGGGTSETITVSGLATTDLVMVHRHTKGATPVTCTESRVTAANTITLTFSADPNTDHKFNILVFTPLN